MTPGSVGYWESCFLTDTSHQQGFSTNGALVMAVVADLGALAEGTAPASVRPELAVARAALEVIRRKLTPITTPPPERDQSSCRYEEISRSSRGSSRM